jgi:hypothetical protein
MEADKTYDSMTYGADSEGTKGHLGAVGWARDKMSPSAPEVGIPFRGWRHRTALRKTLLSC